MDVSPHHPGVNDPLTILLPVVGKNSFFRFMVYFQKAEIQRTRLCGFFRWQRSVVNATIDSFRYRIALREKFGDERGIPVQILRSAAGSR